ncbi:MAG: hypothetical protein V4556_12345 [Bacteroidota bacterium]
MKFSERIGKRNIRADIQLDSMDIDLRNSLWNVIDLYINEPLKKENTNYLEYSSFRIFFESLWFSFYKEPMDQMQSYKHDIINNLRNRFFKWDYLDVYDLIDFIVQIDNPPFEKQSFIKGINFILERELSGYRIIKNVLAPIINNNEILEIENALNNTTSDKFKGAHIHLTEALNKLSDRKRPDYRNSIKEAISSIESICQVIANDPKAELGKALKILRAKMPIHGALEQGFLKIYGYTSDSDGIRHALLEESKLEQEDAMFMLVSCSAFVNYLIIKANKMVT